MNYSKAFRIVRAAFGLSQAEFSHILQVGPSQISLIESGKRQPSHKLIQGLTEALRIPTPLITLLASQPQELGDQEGQALEGLAMSLLRLLVSASEARSQPALLLKASQDSGDA